MNDSTLTPLGFVAPFEPMYRDAEKDESDLEMERKGKQDDFDEESATFMDDEQIIVHKRTDYPPEMLSDCGTGNKTDR